MGKVTDYREADRAGGAKPIAILCDRNSLFREAVVKLLGKQVLVVATTSMAQELPALILQHKPQLVLLELDLYFGPQVSLGSFDSGQLSVFLRSLLDCDSKPQLIGLACSYHATLYFHRLKDILSALCFKPGIIEELPVALAAVLSGEGYCSSVIEELLEQKCRHEFLTDCEFQILLRISLSDEVIASELSLPQAQVADAVVSLCGKLAVASRPHACLWALAQGYKLLPVMNLLAEEEEAEAVAKRIIGG